MISPAIVNDHRMIDHVEIPVVITVGPGATTMEFRTRAGKQLTGKTIGIATVVRTVIAATVVIVIGVAINDHVTATELVPRIELWRSRWQRLGFLDTEILIHAYLQTRIVIVMENALFDDIIGTFHLHAVILRIAKREPLKMPIVGQMVHIDTATHLEFTLSRMMHSRTVDNHFFSWHRPQITASVS